MKLSRIHKRHVNRLRRAERLSSIQDALLERVDFAGVERALDLGCGIGHLTARLADCYDIEVTGVDVDPDQVEGARELYGDREHLRFAVVEEAEVPLPDDTFDLIQVFHVLHHSPCWRELVDELARLLRSEGWLILYEVSLAPLISWLFSKKRYGVYTGDELRRAFREAGFSLVWLGYDKGFFIRRHAWVLRRF